MVIALTIEYTKLFAILTKKHLFLNKKNQKYIFSPYNFLSREKIPK